MLQKFYIQSEKMQKYSRLPQVAKPIEGYNDSKGFVLTCLDILAQTHRIHEAVQYNRVQFHLISILFICFYVTILMERNLFLGMMVGLRHNYIIRYFLISINIFIQTRERLTKRTGKYLLCTNLFWRILQGDMIAVFKYFKGYLMEEGSCVFVWSQRTELEKQRVEVAKWQIWA